VKTCWEEKAKEIPKSSDQKQVNSYGTVKLEDPESHRSWTINGQRLKHYLGGEILKSHCGCRSVFAQATRISSGRNLQRKKEKMWNCNSRPGDANLA